MLLYALLVVQPLLSLAGSMLRGDRITVRGDFAVPVLLSANQPRAHLVFQLQGWNALLLLVLVSMQIAAALFRHRVHRGQARLGRVAEGNARASAAVLGASAPIERI